jgi:septal ring factor EnvC (AmiA/AmiB activator)
MAKILLLMVLAIPFSVTAENSDEWADKRIKDIEQRIEKYKREIEKAEGEKKHLLKLYKKATETRLYKSKYKQCTLRIEKIKEIVDETP